MLQYQHIHVRFSAWADPVVTASQKTRGEVAGSQTEEHPQGGHDATKDAGGAAQPHGKAWGILRRSRLGVAGELAWGAAALLPGQGREEICTQASMCLHRPMRISRIKPAPLYHRQQTKKITCQQQGSTLLAGGNEEKRDPSVQPGSPATTSKAPGA